MKLPHCFYGLAAMVLLTASAPSRADPAFYVSIGGTPQTNAESFDGIHIGSDQHSSFFFSGQLSQLSVSSGIVSSSSTGDVFNVAAQVHLPQIAVSSYSSTASMGALHAVASSNATVSGGDTVLTEAILNRLTAEWHDTVTFHTSNPNGSDFNLGFALDDTIVTSFAGGSASGFAAGAAQALLTVKSGAIFSNINIRDVVKQVGGQIERDSPDSRNKTSVLHVTDGAVFSVTGDLFITASASNSDSAATVNAADTARFSLSSVDPLASYSTASGITFATAVPEAQTGPLILAGLGAVVLAMRRRAKNVSD